MCDYNCLRCNKKFKTKFNFERHLIRKKPCKVIKIDFENSYLIDCVNKNNYNELYKENKNKKQCIFCKKILLSKNMNRHINLCKSNPNNNSDINNTTKNTVINNNIQKNQTQVINNIHNQTNNINININSFGNESFDIKEITQQLKFVLGYGNFNGNQLQYKDRIDNIIYNYNIIFDHLYSNPKNHNFDIVNKKNKICKIKDKDSEEYIHIHFNDLVDKIFNIIYKIFELSIIDFEFNNDDISLKHYKEFQQKLIIRKNKYIQEYYNSTDIVEKNNIKQSLYIFYKGFQDILSNIKNKIILKVYDF